MQACAGTWIQVYTTHSMPLMTGPLAFALRVPAARAKTVMVPVKSMQPLTHTVIVEQLAAIRVSTTSLDSLTSGESRTAARRIPCSHHAHGITNTALRAFSGQHRHS
jgi:hypothetical protein